MGSNYEDPVARAISDNFYGSHGVRTGTNEVQVQQYEHGQRLRTYDQVRVKFPKGGGTGDGILTNLLDAVPRWLHLLFAIGGGGFACLTFSADVTNFVLGAAAGMVLGSLAFVVLGIMIQLTWALIKFGFVLAVAAVILWILVQLTN